MPLDAMPARAKTRTGFLELELGGCELPSEDSQEPWNWSYGAQHSVVEPLQLG